MVTTVKGSTFLISSNFNYVSLTDVGAKGDGITDNTAAINLAFATGLPVFIPSGTFITSGLTLPANAILFGSGSSSILKLKISSNVQFLQTSGGIDFSSFTLDCNKAGQVGASLHGITLTNGIVASIFDVDIINALGDGIKITGVNSQNITCNKLRISGAVRNGITIENGTNITLNSLEIYSGDAVGSPGDGIALAPIAVGSLVSEITIIGCKSRGNTGRGLSMLGFGGRNVTDINVVGGTFSSNISHGIHAFNAQNITISSVNVKNNGGDGGRLEADVQSSRISECIFTGNGGFGLREVTTGTTPNLNGLIYNVALLNGNNTITKVGASSFIV